MAHADPSIVATVYTVVVLLSVVLGSWLYDVMRKRRLGLFERLEGDLRTSAVLTVAVVLIAPLYMLLFDVRPKSASREHFGVCLSILPHRVRCPDRLSVAGRRSTQEVEIGVVLCS